MKRLTVVAENGTNGQPSTARCARWTARAQCCARPRGGGSYEVQARTDSRHQDQETQTPFSPQLYQELGQSVSVLHEQNLLTPPHWKHSADFSLLGVGHSAWAHESSWHVPV